jgi:hypothetical protein
MRKKVVLLTVVLILALALPLLVLAQPGWSDDFDSYSAGTDLHGVGGWKGWGDDQIFTAWTTDTFAHSAPNSVEIEGLADLVHEFSGYTSGLWTLTAWQYIPDNMTGLSYYIWLNQYDDPGANLNWSVQVSFDGATGNMISENDNATLPFVPDEWAELRIDLDLDTDVQTFYYNGTMLYTKSWAEGVSGGGIDAIGAIDLFANNATSVYYDDISIAPTFGIEVMKTPATQDVVSGGTAEWTISVVNVGATDLISVTTSDPLVADCDMDVGDLDAGAVYEYDCSETVVTTSFTNTISVEGSVAGGATYSDTAEAYVNVVPPTSVSLSSFGGSDSGSSMVLVLVAGVIGVGVVLLIARRRRLA